MKTIKLRAMATATVLFLGAALTARAGIVGSPHDFSGETWNIVPSDANSTCGVCHQPHHADSSVVPLWIHTTSAAVFTMYNTNTVAVSHMKAVLATIS
jgi:hypothetical protein